MIYLITLITVLTYAFFRRWYGSNSIWWKVSRGVKCALFLIFTLGCCWYITKNIIWSTVFSGIGYIYFCLAHGVCFDMGRDGMPDEELIKRYNKGIYHYLPDLLIPKEHRYNYLYDFIFMGVRYVLPGMALICSPIVNKWFICIPLMVSPVYAFCWSLKEHDNWLLEKIPYTNAKPTALAEYISGALFGLYPLFLLLN